MSPDVLNAVFEATGGLLTWRNVAAVQRDRGYLGITLPAVLFFWAWGGWNLFYYPHLGQTWSFHAGMFLFAAPTTSPRTAGVLDAVTATSRTTEGGNDDT